MVGYPKKSSHKIVVAKPQRNYTKLVNLHSKMKKTILLITLITFSLYLNAQTSEYYKNGQLRSIGIYENQKKTGEWKELAPITVKEIRQVNGGNIMKTDN